MIKVRSHLVMLILLLMICSLACKSKKSGESGNQTGNGNANAQADMQPGGFSGGKASGGRVFRGAVGGSSVQLTLRREGDVLTGTYFYQRVGSEILLKGSINGQGDFTLQEFDSSGSQTGEFKGKWSEPAGLPTASLEGTWSKPGSKETLSFYATEQVVELSNGLSVVMKDIKEENKKQKYSIKVEYPELTGASNANIDKFNQEVKNLIAKETRAFKEGASETSSDETVPDNGTGSDLQIGYDVTLATNDIISVLFGISNYLAGSVHPNGYSLVINFDLKAGRSLKLADLFIPNSDYLNIISRFAVGDLKRQAGQEAINDWIERGAGPQSDNYSNWNMSRKGLAINFDPYQVASYAEGPKHVLVPYSTLKEISKPDGPISYVNK